MDRSHELLRNRRLSLLFLTVVAPSMLVAVLAVLIFRAETSRARIRTEQRQAQMARFLESELDELFGVTRGPDPSLDLAFTDDGITLERLNVTFSPKLPVLFEPPPTEIRSIQQVEYRGDAAALRRAHALYLKTSRSDDPAGALSRLGLLRIDLRRDQFDRAARWLSEIADRDDSAVTESGIPVWIAASLLLRSNEVGCSLHESSRDVARFQLQVAGQLVTGKWPLRPAQWTFYAEEVLDALDSCFEVLPHEVRILPDLIAELSWLTEQADHVERLAGTLDADNGERLTWHHFPARERFLVVAPGDPVTGFWIEQGALLREANTALAEMTQAEDFQAEVVLAADRGNGDLGLDSLPGFQIRFSDREAAGWQGHFRRFLLLYSALSLLAVMLLGLVFSYRAVSRELEMARLKSDFVAAVSHEFRSPLTSIQALLERIASGRATSPEMIDRYHSAIRQEVRRLNALVSQVLDFSRWRRGREKLYRRPEDLLEVVRSSVDRLSGWDLRQRLELSLENDDGCLVDIDRSAVDQCINNLIDNALKYSPDDSPVHIRAGRNHESGYVEIQDRGVGIPPAEQDRIFEEFYRGTFTDPQNVKGTGLGLALVRRIVEGHQGSIQVESRPGGGSVFRIELPLLREANGATTGRQARERGGG